MSETIHDKSNPIPDHRFGESFLRDPYETYTYLRETGPVNYSELYGWLIARYEEVHDGLKNPQFSADRSGLPTSRLSPEVKEELADFDDLFGRWLLFKDPPRHTELRKLVNRSFTPRVMERWRPRIRELVVEFLDAIADKDEVDFLTEFAYELPAAVIIEMLGVDRADQDEFVSWSTDVANFFGTPSPTADTARRAQSSLVTMADYFRPHVAAAREKPPSDERETLVTILARAQAETDAVSEEDVLAQCTLFLFAGHETTRNLLGSGLLLLLQNPDQMSAIEDDPAHVKSAVQEILRYESPIQTIHRVAKQSGEFYGAEIEEGDSVVLLIGSANRDPATFLEPDRFDVFREDVGHQVAFGFGPHFCLGAPLALIEGEIAFEEITRRLPDLELADDGPPDWSTAQPQFRNLQSLWVRPRG